MKKAYIVLLNYKGHRDTVECLESLLKLDYPTYQIIVVDNSPTDESVHYFKQWAEGRVTVNTSFPELVYPLKAQQTKVEFTQEDEIFDSARKAMITVVKAKENKGFAAGNNVALRYIQQVADFDYIWLLNNDTVVPPNALQELVRYFESSTSTTDKKLGLLGATLLYYHAPATVQGVGGVYNKFLAASTHQGEGKSFAQICESHLPIDYVIGASMLVSNEFLQEVGLMAEEYFLYYEEIDWASRAKKYSYTFDYCPSCMVYHKEGASINNAVSYANKKSELADYYGIRNRILFTGKNYPLYLPFTYLSFLLIIVNRIKRKEYNKLGMILKIMLNPSRPY